LSLLHRQNVSEDYPCASDRLHHFILGAGRDLVDGCARRGLACVQHIDCAARHERGLVHRLGANAAAILLEDQPTFVARWPWERVAARAGVAVYAVDAACLVPPAVIGDGISGQSGFLRCHDPERSAWTEVQDLAAERPPYAGPLPFTPDRLDELDPDALITELSIDHTFPASAMHPAGRAAALDRLHRLIVDVLPGYASARNDATRPDGASGLSPYLHLGVLGPREIMAAVAESPAGRQHKAKFADDLLDWREWLHSQASHLKAPERYDRVATWARQRWRHMPATPGLGAETLTAMLRAETRDETWNACQRPFLIDGWMRNNLRMYGASGSSR
jgi:deoxyribodipyrimidine photolyase